MEDRAADLIAFRRDVHAHPEVAWAEVRTSASVMQQLLHAGLEPRRVGLTGVVCDIPATAPSASPHRRIALRADLDALPIEEETGLPFSSTNPGAYIQRTVAPLRRALA